MKNEFKYVLDWEQIKVRSIKKVNLYLYVALGHSAKVEIY
jgi:hypothetical protein